MLVNFAMSFNLRLVQALNNANKTQSDLAAHLGITPQAVQQWCIHNGTTPRNKRVAAIANYLGVSQAWLFTGNTDVDAEISAESDRQAVKRKISLLTQEQKTSLNNMSIDEMRKKLQSLDSEQQAIIQAMLESWSPTQQKD